MRLSKLNVKHLQEIQINNTTRKLRNISFGRSFEIVSTFLVGNSTTSHYLIKYNNYPAGNCMFKVNNRNTRARCEICSKLTIKIPERCQLRRSGIFIVNFEHISHLVLVFLLLTLSR